MLLRVEVTNVDETIGPQSVFLRQFKKLCPGVAAMFHCRRTHYIHVVGHSGITAFEQHVVANALLAVGGEVLPLSDADHAALRPVFASLREAALSCAALSLQPDAGEDIVESAPNESTGRAYYVGVRAPTAARRREIIDGLLSEMRTLADLQRFQRHSSLRRNSVSDGCPADCCYYKRCPLDPAACVRNNIT